MKGYFLKTDKIKIIQNHYEPQRIIDLPPSEVVPYDKTIEPEMIEYKEEVIEPLVLAYDYYGDVERKVYYIQDNWIRNFIDGIQGTNNTLRDQQRDLEIEIKEVNDLIRDYNKLPWYIKMFKWNI